MSESAPTIPKGAGDILAVGFGTTVAMWGIGYLARLPVILAPPSLVLALLLAALVCGGFVIGRRAARGVAGGASAGALTGLLNLLVLGSFLSTRDRPDALVPTALAWLPGSIALSSALGAAGAWWGARTRARPTAGVDWTAAFARVAVAATFLLLVAGGLVTSNKAGLAVVDWPRSYGYNMFLYPFARMTGGIYYEHAHRLLGALVGLTTLTLAIHLLTVETRAIVKRMAVVAAVLVVAQGILGGLRVTERNLYLAVVHGVVAQVFFALLVSIAVVCSVTWRRGPPEPRKGVSDETLATVAVVALLIQIVFGAIQRHLALGLMLHVVSAFVVAGLTIAAGVRAWGLNQDVAVLKRAGLTVVYATGLQLALGFSAWIARGAATSGALSDDWKIVLTTMHQGMGALLLASMVALSLWIAYFARRGQPSSR
jgi:cytochrome c oxidase assembly protein subunit 15